MQRGLAADLAVVMTKKTDWGVFTAAPLRAGEFVVEYAGALLKEEEASMVDEHNDFLFKISDEWTLDPKGTKRGGVGAFLNHSCAPNCVMQKVHIEHDFRSLAPPRMALFANQDIPAKAELTWSYGPVRATLPSQAPCAS